MTAEGVEAAEGGAMHCRRGRSSRRRCYALQDGVEAAGTILWTAGGASAVNCRRGSSSRDKFCELHEGQ